MKLPNRNSFLVGFFSAVLLLLAVYIWQSGGFVGGVGADSPDGRYSVLVTGPITPASGGSYEITLLTIPESTVVRHVAITLPDAEQTVALRGGGGNVVWDSHSRFADVNILGHSAFRLWVP